MTKQGGWKHSRETRAKIAQTSRARWEDPEKRAAASEATKARMADPAVRERIRAGMRKAALTSDDLSALRVVWRKTSAAARARFLNELFSAVCSTSAPEPHDRSVT